MVGKVYPFIEPALSCLYQLSCRGQAGHINPVNITYCHKEKGFSQCFPLMTIHSIMAMDKISKITILA